MSVSPENSTNVRFDERDPSLRAWSREVAAAFAPTPPAPRRAPMVPWWIRFGMGALGTVAPPLASAWAEQLFLTPPRHPAPDAERALLARAHAGDLRLESGRIATWTWGRGPTVLLAHGWGGRGGQLGPFVEPLLALGYSVVAFDGPGHGASDGRTSSLVEHSRALRAVADALPSDVHAVVAHSMGCAATSFALAEGLALDRAVFVAPPTAVSDWAADFARAFGLSDGLKAQMQRRVEERLGVPWAELDMARIAPRMRTRLLIVHDHDDKEVPYASGEAVAATWPGARLHPTEGLGHRRILADGGVVRAAVAFLGDAPTAM